MEASEIEQARKKQYIHKRAEDIRASWLLFCLVGIPVLIVYPFLLVWYWIKGD
jgi:hypothetical protein